MTIVTGNSILNRTELASPALARRKGQDGQALIETVIALPLTLIITFGIFSTLYLILATSLMDHWVYEANLCLARGKPTYQCQWKLQKNLSSFVFHRTSNLELESLPRLTKVTLKTQVYGQPPKVFRSELPQILVSPPTW